MPSRLNPSFFTSPSNAWLSKNVADMILRTPSANISANTCRSASAVVPCPQNVRLKMQWASARTGLTRVDVTTPPRSPSRHTAQLRCPAASLRSQESMNSSSVFSAKSSQTERRDSCIHLHTRGRAYAGYGDSTVTVDTALNPHIAIAWEVMRFRADRLFPLKSWVMRQRENAGSGLSPDAVRRRW
jgi:hypothetical protein